MKSLFVLLPLIFELFDIRLPIPRAEPLSFESVSSIYTVPAMTGPDAVAIWLESALVQWLSGYASSCLLLAQKA
jgi:hypothetical protein